MDISKASSLGDVGEVEGGVEITLDLPAMKAELARVQAKCSIRGLAQVILLDLFRGSGGQSYVHGIVLIGQTKCREIPGNFNKALPDFLIKCNDTRPR